MTSATLRNSKRKEGDKDDRRIATLENRIRRQQLLLQIAHKLLIETQGLLTTSRFLCLGERSFLVNHIEDALDGWEGRGKQP